MQLPDIRLLWSEDERVKKQLILGRPFVEMSKYPSITRDISFVVSKEFIPNNYFDLIRDLGGSLVQEVKLLDHFDNTEKFGADKVSYTFRSVYQSLERTLTNAEVDTLHKKLEGETVTRFSAVIR
jgi:phenylalanyl-tRNA synthetase alpha chain